MQTKTKCLWKIGHDGGEHADVWVSAKNWELATVEAAGVWGVPWATVAAYCVLREKKKLLGGVCSRCGRYYSGGGILCGACTKVQETEEEILRRQMRRAYRSGKLI